MLVLARSLEQPSIRIGASITVTLLRSGDGKVSLGIDAPRHIPIHRLELLERLIAEEEARRAFDSTEEDS